MKRADYGKIAEFYDRGRRLSETNLHMWIEPIRANCAGKKRIEVADLGCGTGRFSIPMAYYFGFGVTGIDASREMLEKARAKDWEERVTWMCGNLEGFAFDDESFDAIFMSHLLHHLTAPKKFLENCLRMLRRGGSIYVRYGAIEQIRDDVVHRFFPETLVIDEARTPSIEQVENWLQETGFERVESTRIAQKTFNSAAARCGTIAAKGTSVLTLISQTEFEKGLEEVSRYIRENPDDPWLRVDEMTLTVGFRT